MGPETLYDVEVDLSIIGVVSVLNIHVGFTVKEFLRKHPGN